MSSPMMTRMFGLCGCGWAGTGAAAMNPSDARRPSAIALPLFIVALLAHEVARPSVPARSGWRGGDSTSSNDGSICGRPTEAPARGYALTPEPLITRVAGIRFLHLLQHLREVVALRRLQRRELFVC